MRFQHSASIRVRPYKLPVRTHIVTRIVAFVLALCVLLTFGAPAASYAAVQAVKDAKAGHAAQLKLHAAIAKAMTYQEKRISLPIPNQKRWSGFSLKPRPTRPAYSPTLLDEIGLLAHPVSAQEVAAWKNECAASNTYRTRALAHLWLGEYLLAHDQDPEKACQQFQQAKALAIADHKPNLCQLAAYDTATAYFYEGAYADSADAFHALTALPRHKSISQTPVTGYSLMVAARWYKHAASCAGYHNVRSCAGIPEPRRLDPRCAAASLATCLRSLKMPCDPASVMRVCPVNGEGSSLQDVLDASAKLNLKAYSFGADDQGLMAAPKPLVAFVERDHFIAVTQADKKGVTYLCSDCSAWPGGQVHLTWKQWRLLDASVYTAIVKPGSLWDNTLQEVLALPYGKSPAVTKRLAMMMLAQKSQVQVASAGPLSGLMKALLQPSLTMVSLLRLHIIQKYARPILDRCGNKPQSQPCFPFQHCAYPCQKKPGGGGPSEGDPVNLATGEEEYTPPADLNIYNPVGPAVSWGRIYNSLRSPETTYEADDFGPGWSQPYNVGIYDPTDGAPATSAVPQTRYIVMPNGARVSFTLSATPSTSAPSVSATVYAGAPMLVTWNYNGSGDYYIVTFSDRTKWVTTPLVQSVQSCELAQMIDCNGNAIAFHYGTPAYTGGWPLLSSITNTNGTALLSILRAPDGTGNITCISDCYGRSIYYHVGIYPTTEVPSAFEQSYQQLDWVSQIVPSCTPNPPGRYAYGYINVGNGDNGLGGGETIPFLHSITVPSPTGTGTSTATINYGDGNSDGGSGYYVASTVDGNGNTTTYTSVPNQNSTQVSIAEPSGTVDYAYTTGFDNNMSESAGTNGAGQTTGSAIYADPNDPYAPSSVTDGNGHTTSYAYDQYGNVLASLSTRGVTTDYNYNYSNFALGELVEYQEGTKSPSMFDLYEPSGLLQSWISSKPGTVGSPATTSITIVYDKLGNVTSITTPGNDTVTSKVTTLSYTQDGSFSQSESLQQPLAVTDNNGNSVHYRYDNQGNIISTLDALGNETDQEYNIANDSTYTMSPATGQTGNGRTALLHAYTYPGGNSISQTTYDEWV